MSLLLLPPSFSLPSRLSPASKEQKRGSLSLSLSLSFCPLSDVVSLSQKHKLGETQALTSEKETVEEENKNLKAELEKLQNSLDEKTKEFDALKEEKEKEKEKEKEASPIPSSGIARRGSFPEEAVEDSEKEEEHPKEEEEEVTEKPEAVEE